MLPWGVSVAQQSWLCLGAHAEFSPVRCWQLGGAGFAAQAVLQPEVLCDWGLLCVESWKNTTLFVISHFSVVARGGGIFLFSVMRS